MALGTITRTSELDGPGLKVDHLSFAGDGAYPVGGTVDFEGSLQAKTKDSREVLGIIQVDASGYVLRYDKANDKLMVFEGNYDAADGPLQQSSTADLSGTTFKVIVFSK